IPPDRAAPPYPFQVPEQLEKQAAQSSTLANRPVSVRPRPPTPEGQLAGILNAHYVAPRAPGRRAADGMEHHLLSRHSVVVQEAPELHLSCPPTRKALDTGAGALNEGSVQGDPPFSSRRSPNRPSPN